MSETPKLPPTSPAAQASRRKVIDLARAVGSSAARPVLDIVTRRMYRDWLRGVRPRTLRVVYGGSARPMLIDHVDDILRREAAKQESAKHEAAQRERAA